MRRAFPVYLVASIYSLMLAAPAYASFSDVPSSHPNYDAINYVQAQGIVSGYPDGTYRPDQSINRAEFTKIIIEATLPKGGDPDCGSTWGDGGGEGGGFIDVNKHDWFVNYVCRAWIENIVQGYEDGFFRPGNPINFVEAAKIIALSFNLNLEGSDLEAWYKPHVLALENRYAIPPTIKGFAQNITRGEMAEMIYRLKAGVTNKSSQTYESLQSNSSASSSDTRYIVQYNLSAGSDVPLEEQYDGQIIAINTRTGQEKVIVSSIKDSLPAILEPWNLTIDLFAQPAGASPIFRTVLKETDNAGGELYRLDTATGRFTKMNINNVFDGFYDGSTLSPDNRHLVWARQPDPQKQEIGLVQALYIGFLVDDSYEPLVTLQGNETLNGGEYALSSNFDSMWIDDHTVRFAVYDQQKKQQGLDALIEYRTITIDE